MSQSARWPLFLILAGTTALAQTEANPCADFYEYACGAWRKANPIPADRSSWDPYYVLEQKNEAAVRGILERRTQRDDAEGRKVRDYYAACTDQATIKKKGLGPFRAELARIAKVRTPEESVSALAAVHTLRIDALFSFYAGTDLKDATRVIANLDLAGLGLRDRDDYLKDDPETKQLRRTYRAHVAKMLRLTGLSKKAAAAGADTVLRLETELAKASPSREQRRDPAGQYHLYTRAQLEALTPGWPWSTYFAATGAPPIDEINVPSPQALQTATRQWLALSAADREAYLRWELVNVFAVLLPAKLDAQDFHFYGTVLRGTKQMPPRWKRCARLASAHLGEAIGRLFVAEHFPAGQKERVLAQLRLIQAALREDITTLPWMSDTTRAAALRKLETYRFKIGYPDRWRDYSGLEIRRDDALGNALRARRFEFARRIAKMGKPVDREEWFSLPQEVDGYESSSRVELVFTAGFLQAPFFDPTADDATNFGAIGRAMGHEFLHGFDDEGRLFDANGNMRDWWGPKDAAGFEQRAQCFVDEYSKFEVVDGKTLNGKLTLGENLADNGGLRLAYAALQKRLADKPRGAGDGPTPEQRFFLAFARTQCVNTTDETERHRLLTDPHSPGRWRVNGTVRNMSEFQKAFACKDGDPMVSAQPCRVW